MEQQNSKKRFGWGYFIVGILFIFASMVAFFDPARNLVSFVIVFAAMAIVHGLWAIIESHKSILRIIMGILNIVLGVFMIFNIYYALAALPFVFSIWFIVDSTLRLFSIGFVRQYSTGHYIFLVIMNIIGIVVGFMLLSRPLVALLTLSFMVGFYFMTLGIDFIVLAFGNPHPDDYSAKENTAQKSA